ncbi:MAG TPA: GntR family transcriptional regulator [Solirubrobacteraceae bacterium]|nr:GntR family transcriptional regulator [Solirubrobacteraceae bacterium]
MAVGGHRSVAEPRYYTVKRHLLEVIESIDSGDSIPTERELSSTLGTSRTTVRKAISELVGEGRLARMQGSGTYVAEPKITWPLDLGSFTEHIAASGFHASSELLGAARVSAPAEQARQLGITTRMPVYRLDRVRLADDWPIAVESSWLSARRFPGLTRAVWPNRSLQALLSERYGVRVQRGSASVQTAAATPRQAAPLGVEVGAALLLVERRNIDADGEPVEWSQTWFRGDRVTLVAQLGAPAR